MCHTSIHASSTGNEDEENTGKKGISRKYESEEASPNLFTDSCSAKGI